MGKGASGAVIGLLLVLTLGQTPIGNVDVGTIIGAPYRIEMPAQWNKGLIMYAHG